MAGGSASGPILGPNINIFPPDEGGPGAIAELSLPGDKQAKYVARFLSALERGEVTPDTADRLAGSVEWVATAALSQGLRPYLWPIRDQSRRGRKHLDLPLRVALETLAKILSSFQPVKIFSSVIRRRTLIGFVDARGRSTPSTPEDWGKEYLGGVIFSEAGGAYFMLPVTPVVESQWMTDRDSRINEAEALAALVFVTTFTHILQDCDVLLFVDSSASEGVLIKNYSSSPCMCMISAAFWDVLFAHRAGVYIHRLPSALNLADSFSRGDDAIGVEYGWQKVRPVIPAPGKWNFLRGCFARHVSAQHEKAEARKLKRQAIRHPG